MVRAVTSSGAVEFVYEAGPCGYDVQRQIEKLGHRCVVIAPGLGCRLAWSRRGNRFLLKTPKQKKRVAFMARIREVLQRAGRMTVQAVIQRINPILRGWVNYFRIGHASKTFGYLRWYVERRIRRLALRKKLRHGYGWKKWSSAVIYGKWGLYDDYRVSYCRPTRENDLPLLRAYGLS